MPSLATPIRKLRRIPWLIQQFGMLGTLRYAWQRLATAPPPVAPGHDLLGYYDFVLKPEVETLPVGDPRVGVGTMNWVVPGFGVGSGGHINIFRLIGNLEKQGFRCRLCVVQPHGFHSVEQAEELLRRHFPPMQAEVVLDPDDLGPAEFAVATSWETAYTVRALPECIHRLYFVQDFEPFFFARGSQYFLAEQTYRFGFTAITAGDWLTTILRRDYRMQARPIGFSYDHHRYHPHPRRQGPRRVFFYARSVTPRRGFELGLLALHEVSRRCPEVEFVLAGWDTGEYQIPFPHLNAGVVALDDLPDLYSQCEVALVLSFTNLSLLPLELMACGCPVVSNRGPNVEWLLRDGENALLSEADPRALAGAVQRVLEDEDLRTGLRERGLAAARATDWAKEAESMASYLHTIEGPAE